MSFDDFLEGVRFLFNPTTEMHIAAFHGDTKKVKTLLKNGADVNVVDGDGSTPLHLASCGLYGQWDTVYEILNHKPQVNMRDLWNQTPLHILVSNGPYNMLMVDHYLEQGADPNTQDENGHAILHIMACFPLEEMHGALSVMTFLIRCGVDINLTCKQGNTPLHWAARYGCVEVVEVLLKYNANMYLKNSKNESPIDIALTLTSPDVLDCLGKHLLVEYGLTKKVNEEYFKKVLEINRLRDFWKQCTIELDQLKEDKVGDTVYSYYDVMTLSPYKMSKLFRNRNTAASIICYEWKTFKIFGQYMYDKWVTAKIRSDYLRNGYLFFRIACPWMPEVVVDRITSFLDDDDLCDLFYALYQNGYRTSN